jgi:hypothetical protein
LTPYQSQSYDSRRPGSCTKAMLRQPRKMQIRIKNSDDLDRLLDASAEEIVAAHGCHRLYCGLVDAYGEYKDEMNRTPAFWEFTIASLRDMRFLRLCRIYDQEPKRLNLHNLLDTIRQNPHLFDREEFRQRLKENQFVDSLASHPRTPDPRDIEKHLAYVSEENPTVKKLIVWRNNVLAHRGAKLSLAKGNLLEKGPISEKQVDELLDQALKIFNHYSGLFRASMWLPKRIGEEDYGLCLGMIRNGINARKESFRK